MKKTYLTLCCIFLLQSLVSSQEKLILTTDRDIYIGGESIWFTVNNICNETFRNSDLSKVTYLEVLNSVNTPIIQQKLFLSEGSVTSMVTIPDSVSTGNYLVRCYTRWMSNYSPDNYEAKVISIINPFANNSLPQQSVDEGMGDQEAVVYPKKNISGIEGLKATYTNRQKVKVDLDVENLNWNSLTVSVVKTCLYKPVDFSSAGSSSVFAVDGTMKVPEYKGEIIKGRVINTNTNEFLVNEKMMLSFLSENPVLEFSETNEKGEFVFEANRFGRQEMVIQPYSPDTALLNYKIELEDNYSGHYSTREMPALDLDTVRVNEINKAIINMQINTIYASHMPEIELADSIEQIHSFYGDAENTILIDKYIDLPTTEEVVREIVPYVSLRKSKGQYDFRVYEEKSLYPRDGGSLTFVDGVPVRDANRILGIDPKYLEKIDVINLNYYIRDENLGRLVLFYTRENDMGNMDFDQRIFRQVHDGFLNSYTYDSPDYSMDKLEKSRLADYRNVLYYSSYNHLNDKKKVGIEFYTGDDSSDYTMIITGVNKKGEKEVLTRSFAVQ
ncbi:hypothetical protein [Carboxylicivirga sp. RSCT41]|uniref:hypothetical protein n=1 Tax=Carboxylicivirga agarovorans TaxID=3417570 RepID=UPI003D33F307